MSANPNEVSIVRRKDFAKRIGVSGSTFDRLRRSGRIAPACHVTKTALGWPSDYVAEVVAQIAAGSFAEQSNTHN